MTKRDKLKDLILVDPDIMECIVRKVLSGCGVDDELCKKCSTEEAEAAVKEREKNG